MNPKIWYYFCLLFFIYNIILLNREKYHQNYKLIQHIEKPIDESFNITLCFPFDELVNDHLFCHFEGKNDIDVHLNVTSFLDFVYDFLAKRFESSKTDPFAENPLVNKESSYFFNNYSCFFANQTRLKYLNAFQKFRYLIFAFQNMLFPYFALFVHHKKSNSSNLIMLKLHKFKGQYQ